MRPPEAKERRYADIDPERCWKDWLAVRSKMADGECRGSEARHRRSELRANFRYDTDTGNLMIGVSLGIRYDA